MEDLVYAYGLRPRVVPGIQRLPEPSCFPTGKQTHTPEFAPEAKRSLFVHGLQNFTKIVFHQSNRFISHMYKMSENEQKIEHFGFEKNLNVTQVFFS